MKFNKDILEKVTGVLKTYRVGVNFFAADKNRH